MFANLCFLPEKSLVCTGANGTGPAASVTLAVQSAAGHHGGGQLDGATLAALLLGLLVLHGRRRLFSRVGFGACK